MNQDKLNQDKLNQDTHIRTLTIGSLRTIVCVFFSIFFSLSCPLCAQEGSHLQQEIKRLKAQQQEMVTRKEHDAAVSDLEEARRSLDRLNQSIIEMAPREQLAAARKETQAWQDKGAALREELRQLAVKSEDLRVQVA